MGEKKCSTSDLKNSATCEGAPMLLNAKTDKNEEGKNQRKKERKKESETSFI
jgi:hypothetical protein